MRTYENLMILKPDVTDESADQFLEPLKELIGSRGGEVELVDKWGVRKLAYRVDKSDDGYYILTKFQGGSDLVEELERRLRVSDTVLKFLTTRLDVRLKRVEKRKKARDARAAKRPAPTVTLPSEPPEERSAAPGMPVR